MSHENTEYSKENRFLIGTIFLVIFALVVTFSYIYIKEQASPSQPEMRRYLVSKMSDEEIREIYARAEERFETERQMAKRREEEFWGDKSEELKKCKDIAYKTKNPSACSLPLTWTEIGKPSVGWHSVSEIYERELLGICWFASTIYDAKKMGCLP